MKKKQVVHKKMKLSYILKRYPQTKEIFVKMGLICPVCSTSLSETIEKIALTNGYDAEEIVSEINKAIKKK